MHLTAGRSLAVDKALHVYGTPFFLEGQLPIESDTAKDNFRRLMVAQDTGSAIVGPARGDIYFGAGADAGRLAGRLRHPIRFVMLLPKSLDPVEATRAMPLPEPRPSAEIELALAPKPEKAAEKGAKKDAKKDAKGDMSVTEGSAEKKSVSEATTMPVPQARPERRKKSPPRRMRHHPPT